MLQAQSMSEVMVLSATHSRRQLETIAQQSRGIHQPMETAIVLAHILWFASSPCSARPSAQTSMVLTIGEMGLYPPTVCRGYADIRSPHSRSCAMIAFAVTRRPSSDTARRSPISKAR